MAPLHDVEIPPPDMYFCTGQPRTYSHGGHKPGVRSNRNVIRSVYSEDFDLLACVTPVGVTIWSGGKYRILLGALERQSTAALEAEGPYVDICWCTFTSQLAALTTNGFVHVFTVTPVKEGGGFFSSGSAAWPGLSYSQVDIKQARTIECGKAAFCLVDNGSSVLVGTENMHIALVPWSGHGVQLESLCDNVFNGSSEEAVVDVHVRPHIRMLAIVTSSGRAGLCFCKTDTMTLQGKVTWNRHSFRNGSWLAVEDGTCVRINDRRLLVSVGTSQGHTKMFSIAKGSGNEACGCLEMSHWNLDPEETGGVECMQWTDDGHALAVGYSKRGVAVWSPVGTRLSCTIPQFSGGRCLEPARHGASCVVWATQGYFLLIAAKDEDQFELCELSFIKQCCIHNVNKNEAAGVTFQGSDSIVLLKHSPGKRPKWSHVEVKKSYINDNWPIRYVAPDKDGRRIAVSGTHGVAVLCVNTGKWETFNDLRQERATSVRGLLWHGDILVLVHETGYNSVELRCFHPDQLDLDGMLLCERLDCVPACMDVHDDYLLVIAHTHEAVLYHFNGQWDDMEGMTKLSIEMISTCRFADNLPVPAYVCLSRTNMEFGASSANQNGTTAITGASPTQCFMLRGNGRLSILTIGSGREAIIMKNAENFWFVDALLTESTLWCYSSSGLQLLYPGQRREAFICDSILETDKEVMCQGILSGSGVIVGVSSVTTFHGSSLPTFSIRPVVQPFLHSIFKYLLRTKSVGPVRSLCANLAHLPYLTSSLELLLYSCYEDEFRYFKEKAKQQALNRSPRDVDIASAVVKPPDLFKRVLELLHHSVHYHLILVNCARKTDYTGWSHYFDLVGRPEVLFQECVSSGELRTAALYLLVIQTMEGQEVCQRLGMELFRQSLQTSDVELIAELVRFLSSRFEMGSESGAESAIESPPPRKHSSVDATHMPAILFGGRRGPLEEVLCEHLHELFREGRMSPLMHLCRGLGIDPADWLVQEAANVKHVERYSVVLSKIHGDMAVPKPSNSLMETAIEATVASARTPHGGQGHPLCDRIADLRTLSSAARHANLNDWRLVLSTTALNIDDVVSALTMNLGMWHSYKAGLVELSSGYEQLAAFLETKLSAIQVEGDNTPR